MPQRHPRHAATALFPTVALWRKRLAEPAEGIYFLRGGGRGGGRHLGLHTTTRPRRKHAAMAMAVHDAWQGQGIGSALMAAAIDMAENWSRGHPAGAERVHR
ncbi:MAG: GNAT family N-acetyltransferase [Caldilineaceae bacterium]